MDLVARAKKVLADNIYITISTINSDSTPWTTPLFFALGENFTFYWMSKVGSQHGENIKRNPQVSGTVFDSRVPVMQGIGVYVLGSAKELNDEATIQIAATSLFNRLKQPVPPPSAFLGAGVYRIYCFTPRNVWVTPEKVNGQEGEARTEVALK